MLDTLRTPFLLIALLLFLVAVLAETGTPLLVSPPPVLSDKLDDLLADAKREEHDVAALTVENLVTVRGENPTPPGMGIPYLAPLDFLVLFTLCLVAASLLLGERIHGRIQGVATLIVSFLLAMVVIWMILEAVAKLVVMLSLFLSPPFGTIAYLAIYGFFDRPGAAATLSLLMLAKLGAAVCLVLAQQRFLQNKGLVLILLTSLLAGWLVALLHNLVPIVLVSITDALAAIVGGILAAIWALVFLIGAIVSVAKVLRIDRAA